MAYLRRVGARLWRLRLDLLALSGMALVAFGLGQWPGWGQVLGPVSLGVWLLLTVRYGAR